jgi:hypothetical protein
MRIVKWIVAAALIGVSTAACVETTTTTYRSQQAYRPAPAPANNGGYWNSPRADADHDGIPNRYDRDANGDRIPDRYQGR